MYIHGNSNLITKNLNKYLTDFFWKLQPNKNIYESIGIFCPEKQIKLLDSLQAEDVLVDWSEPLYLNFTHIAIMKYLESFYTTSGSTEMILGDIYVCRAPPDRLELDR